LGAVTLPFAVHAQRAGKPPVIGYIGANSEAIDRPRINAFMQRLSDLGWAEGRNIAVDARFTQGVVARAGEIAAEFVRRPVDLILTAGDAQVIAAKKATDAIPIVFAAVGDPVGNGLVASLPNPGGNATGLSLQLTDSVGKRVDLLRDLLPNLRHIGLIGNFINPTVAPAIEKLKGLVEALYVCQDPLVGSNIAEINASAIDARLPAMFSVRELAERGGLISYGPDLVTMYRRAAEMADKILRGAKPADIPVEQPTQFNLAINLKTANALGLKVPDALLPRADQVIE
jgi:putative ABC transport system substrate-binding protein